MCGAIVRKAWGRNEDDDEAKDLVAFERWGSGCGNPAYLARPGGELSPVLVPFSETYANLGRTWDAVRFLLHRGLPV